MKKARKGAKSWGKSKNHKLSKIEALNKGFHMLALISLVFYTSMFGVFFVPIQATAADTTYKNPTANAANGLGDQWSDAHKAYTNGSGSAYNDDNERHRYYDFNFGVPSGATIDGITVKADAKASDSFGCDLGIDLSWNGGSSWTSEKKADLTNSETTFTLGGSSDTWGHTWTDAQTSNGNFRARVHDIDPGFNCDNSATTYIDWLRIKVNYTEAKDNLEITNATVNGSSSTTVAPSASVNLRVYVTTWAEGVSQDNDWESTSVKIEGGSWQCKNHEPDHTMNGDYDETYSITAPGSVGIYDVEMRAYANDTCNSSVKSDIYKLSDAIIIECAAPGQQGEVGQCTTDNGYAGYHVCTADYTWGEACLTDYSCGDGQTQDPPEVCDAVNNFPCIPEYGSSCSYCDNCQGWVELQGPYCGDGEKNGDEECDPNAAPSYPPGFYCTDECTVEQIPPVEIVAHKIVCDNEADLPNWGTGGPNITATTAQDYVDSHPGCHFQEGWYFQWGDHNASNPGDNTWITADPKWHQLQPTDTDGYTHTYIYSTPDHFWFREAWQAQYIPFTYNQTNPSNNNNNVSAELYCHTDVLNYDNYDRIDNPEYGQTYHCVGFNVPKTYSVHGYKFNDINGNGIRDCALEGPEQPYQVSVTGVGSFCEVYAEDLLAGWTVFIDENGNGQLDEGEMSMVTDNGDHFGWYWFEGLPAGEYRICEVLNNGYQQTYPLNENNNCHTVNLPEGENTCLPDITSNALVAFVSFSCNFGNQEIPPMCGDGIKNQETEDCDGTDGVGEHQACTVDCTLETLPYCGDSVKNGDEECDGTDGITGDQTCSADCTIVEPGIEATCGDGIVNQPTEECDEGTNNGLVTILGYAQTGSYCTSSCDRVAIKGPYCGDNVKNGTEECDGTDGLAPGETCSAACVVEPVVAPAEKPEGKPVLTATKKAEDKTYYPGDEITYTVTIKNSGTETAYNVKLTDILPNGFTFSDGRNAAWPFGDLNVGQKRNTTYKVTVGADVEAGKYKNTVTALAENHDAVTASAEVKVAEKPGQVLGLATEPAAEEELPAAGNNLSDYIFWLSALALMAFGTYGYRKVALKKVK